MSTTNTATRDSFIQAQDAIAQAAEEKAAQRQHAKHKLTARERLALFFDDGVWNEVGQFIGGSVRAGRIGSAVAAGYGRVQGRMVAAYAQDFSVMGGTLGKVEGDKIVDLIDLGIRMRIPIVGIQDSGGARIQEGVVALAQYGRIFKKTCEASGLVPQISIILGPCAGGAVYQPALTDFIVMTRETSHMFVTGPDVVAATTGEKVTLDQLGGAAIHNFHSHPRARSIPRSTSTLQTRRTRLRHARSRTWFRPQRVSPTTSEMSCVLWSITASTWKSKTCLPPT